LLDYGTRRGGALAEGIFNAAGFVRTAPDLVAPDAQIVMSPVLFPAATATGWGVLPQAHGLTLAVQQGQPYSRGSLTLVSADPDVPLRIETGALSDKRDLPVLRAAIRIAQGIMRQPVMREWQCVPDANPEEQSSDADLDSGIRTQIGTAYHYCGTCALGDTADPLAVVDSSLRVHGIAGLRVADGSVMPTIPNAPLHAPTMMIAERAAGFVLAVS
jgi:choline dehydrogenase